ncbi:hypothetical protein E2C01_028681 [Portunus trituberculatus]|uniref:Uncharacterized protein n=1 Tax=Portunus trituberculatus TaxID=210409 RepID=A0A5B7EM58_PORTR|nr:hypothetical protein [Portunus trituberculatus]
MPPIGSSSPATFRLTQWFLPTAAFLCPDTTQLPSISSPQATFSLIKWFLIAASPLDIPHSSPIPSPPTVYRPLESSLHTSLSKFARKSKPPAIFGPSSPESHSLSLPIRHLG